VYDPKVIRRRRAVLALLVACSLILLTAFFGESGGSSVQRGVGDVIAPVQEVANGALKPARDLVGWVGDTFEAKGENEDLRKERDRLRAQVTDQANAVRELKELRGQLRLDQDLSLTDYAPVSARVIGRSATVWFGTLKVNKGTSDGLADNLPVVASDGEGSGLIGRITAVSGGNAFVTLVTDSSMRVPARTVAGTASGIVSPEPGDPRELVLEKTGRATIRRGDVVVTTGTQDPEYPSFFPSGIPIGRVTEIERPGTDEQRAKVRPYVNTRDLEFVRILTKGIGGRAG
jgi:rod shape-determining protein MreC